MDERPPEERPPWEPRTRFEIERDAAQLRAVQRTLGASVSWIVDTLLLDEDADQSEERTKKVKESKREALEALAYVQDVLLSGGTDIDEERLMSEEDFKKRQRAQQEKQVQTATTEESSFDKAIISPPPLSRPATQIQATNAPRPRTIASHPVLPSSSSSFDSPRLGVSKGPRASALAVVSRGQEAKPQPPWNYTQSNFSSPRGFSAEVPSLAPLPRASTGSTPTTAAVQGQPPSQTPASRLNDPLGVLSLP